MPDTDAPSRNESSATQGNLPLERVNLPVPVTPQAAEQPQQRDTGD
jgi:hypothetical protein